MQPYLLHHSINMVKRWISVQRTEKSVKTLKRTKRQEGEGERETVAEMRLGFF